MSSSLKKRRQFFITGTDTDVGKTYCAVALLDKFNESGLKTLALKPVASGCENTSEGLRNPDALALMQHASIKAPYEEVNPFAFEPAIAPHIAAKQLNKRITVRQLEGFCKGAMTLNRPDILLVEGAGGWRCPINDGETLADLAISLKAEVILVVGIKLGCINHAVLTAEAIRRDGLTVAGWIANCVSPSTQCQAENIASVQLYMNAPLLGVLPYGASPASAYLDLSGLALN
ncbi:MAG TPA: dethiobiotin synthase [Pseudomonadales bacterium]|nr:dethiobiotin synthase [Pseudomonadales bacterium]